MIHPGVITGEIIQEHARTMEPTFPSYLILFVSGLLAGFVDAIAGGGGLITLPALLSVGLPPQLALGTNKFQGSFGTLSAAATSFERAR